MKKFLLIILFISPLLLGQRILTIRSGTLEWDAITPIIGSTISYEVFMAVDGNKVSPILLGETSAPQYIFEFAGEGERLLGVRTVRVVTVNGTRLESEISWSDTNGTVTIDPFVLRWYAVPAAPRGIRVR